MISSNEFRPGTTIEFRNGVWQVIEAMHVKPGKGAAFVQTKLKNLETGEVLKVNFRAGERLPQAIVDRLDIAYLYRDGAQYAMIDTSTGEFLELDARSLAQDADLLAEGLTGITAFRHRERILRIQLPIVVELEVRETPPDERGDTSSGAGKQATLETGAVVVVPFHIRPGDKIRLDTRERKYLARVSISGQSD